MLVNGVMIPITAFLIGKYSSKALLIFDLGIFAIGTLIGAITPNFWLLIVARIVQAIGGGYVDAVDADGDFLHLSRGKTQGSDGDEWIGGRFCSGYRTDSCRMDH